MTTTNTLKHALIIVEHDGLLDPSLGDGNSSLLCQRLKERGIPFMIYSGYDAIEGPCKDALHISKPAADGVLVAAMEGLIRGDTKPAHAISPLLAEQRQIADEYRVLERAIRELHNLMAARNVDPTDHAEMEEDAIQRTAELMRLGRRMLELDASVTIASLRPI